MSSWRVAKHYGFGAAQIPILPEPHNATRLTLAEGFSDLRSEFAEGGRSAMIRRIVGQSPAIALFLLLAVAFFITTLRDYSDRSPIEVVLFDSAPQPLPVIPEVVPEQPLPIPVAVEPPPAQPKPREVAPPPPVEILAERPKPRPRAQPKVRPEPKPPAMPKLAQVAKAPPPPPAVRPKRAPRVQPFPPAKPRIALDAVAPRVESLPRNTPKRLERIASVPRPTPSFAPRLAAPAAPDLNVSSEAPPPRGFRMAAAPSASRARAPNVIPGLVPSPRSPDAPAPTAQRRTRPDGPRPRNRQSKVAPSLFAAPAPVLSSEAAPSNMHRRDDRPTPPQRSRRAPRPTAEVARAPAGVTRVMTPATASRVVRVNAAPTPRGATESRPGLVGVPLADLAVCLMDRDEDRLKQAVLVAVTTQKECVSRAGTYRFVETKNLNSFLMWIDGASGRAIGDRCDELRNALDCLESASQHAAR